MAFRAGASRRDSAIAKWRDADIALEDALQLVHENPGIDQSELTHWRSSAENYRLHFLVVAARVKNRDLTTPAEANSAMIAVKDDIRFLG